MASMNGAFKSENWEAVVVGGGCKQYAFKITIVNGCVAQQHALGPNQWDYFAWRIQ